MDRQTVVHAGQRIVTKAGNVAVVAFVSQYGIPYAYDFRGFPVPVAVCGDAFGGEYDQEVGLAA